MMPLSIGQVLNHRYRIDALLGQGGMGAVYRAWDMNLNIPVAVKENLNTSLEAQRQFGREANILACLSHPNLPRVTDYFFIPGQGQYLVMDLVEGEDLEELIGQHGPLPESQVLGWVAQVCNALAYLHAQPSPIIHRDIKPANIKIRPDGRAMLVDFGIAKIYVAQLSTTSGARAVTPGFSPPEQYAQGRTDARSDVYALGATMYAALVGQSPPDAIDRLARGVKLVPLRQTNPQISSAVEQAVLKAMNVDVARRFQNVDEFRGTLAQGGRAIRAQGPMAPGSAVHPKPVLPPFRSLGLQLLGITGLVAATLTASVLLMSNVLGHGQPTATPAVPVAATERATQEPAAPTPTPPQVATLPLTDEPGTTSATPTPTPPDPTPRPGSSPGAVPTTDTRVPESEEAPSSPSPGGLQLLPGNELVRITEDDADEYAPSFSSDQRLLLIMSNRPGSWQIFALSMDGGDWQRLTVDDSDDYHPRFSPDGTRVIFSSNAPGDRDIYTMAPDGTDWRQLTDIAGGDTYPSYSLDGQRIVFMSERSGSWGVYVMNADGSQQRVVIDTPAAETFPYISPDGQSVVFQSDASGNHEIYFISVHGGEPRQLTDNPARDANPVFSPDGRHIAFETNRDGDYEIYVMDSDGSNPHNQTNFPTSDDQIPSFAPDGKWIVFQSRRSASWDIYRTPLSW
jgi:Tol biopolymer transport system component